MSRIHVLRAAAKNGLHWRTGLSMLFSLHLASVKAERGTHTDQLLRALAVRLKDPLFGGSGGPAIDPSFRIAPGFLRARPGARLMS